MKRAISTGLAVVLLLGLGGLAVLARPGGTDLLSPARIAPVALAVPQPHAAAPAAQGETDAAAAPAAPTASAGLNWIAVPLSNASLINASDLATDIQTNTGKTVATVERWNSVGQNYLTYVHDVGIGNFPLTVGGVYRIAMSGGGSNVVWSLVGDVPDPSQFTYTLRETAGSDLNWIMLPLDKDTVTMASALATDIETHSSGAVTVDTVERWNVTGQNYLTYIHSLGIGDFPVKIGYPYRVTVDVATGSSVTWPVR